MKRIIPAAALLIICFLFTNNVFAQTFSLDYDSVKKAWIPGGYDVELNINATNTGASNASISWKLSKFYKDDPNWKLVGACDNVDCKTTATPGLMDGSSTFMTLPVSPAATANFKIDLNGDDAAMGTKAYVILDMTYGSVAKKATFIATKGTTGVSTALLMDNDISIFPNPASNYIDVLYSASSDVKTIAIYNLIGKVVNVYKVTDKNSARCEFNADMPSGIYLVRIADSKGNVIATRKITHQ